MREIVLVNRVSFDFQGSIAKRALVVGDADNDQRNELICANLQGDLAVFKERNPDRYAYASDLGMVTACLVGDVINSGKNYVTAINTEGWLFIFELTSPDSPSEPSSPSIPIIPTATTPQSTDILESIIDDSFGSKKSTEGPIPLSLLYTQRVPANCKELLIADLDGDGQNEMIIGLTDRVLRTYRWVQIGPDRGKFVGLNKWEFADQIGAVSLNPSRHDNCQDIIVAQPGGTYAKLECFDKSNNCGPTKSNSCSISPPDDEKTGSSSELSQETIDEMNELELNESNEVKTEFISKLTPEYHQLALTQMRNHHVSTEVLGGIRVSKDSDAFNLIVVATLDGTLMLANKDEILWSLQVDHQLFALAILETRPHRHALLSQSESTCTIVPNINIERNRFNACNRQPFQSMGTSHSRKTQYFVACAWNGKTYIVDEERNYLRFKFDEAVSAFTGGNYYFDGRHHSSLIYATFNNQIVLYFDVIVDNIRPMFLMDEMTRNPEYSDFCNRLVRFAKQLNMFEGIGEEEGHNNDVIDNEDDVDELLKNPQSAKYRVIRNLIEDILYSVTDEELMDLANKFSQDAS